MKHIALVLALLFAAGGAFAKPQTVVNSTTDSFTVTVTFAADDSSDSDMLPGAGTCSFSVIIEGSDVIEIYQVPSAATAAASGTLVGAAVTATTTVPITARSAQAGFKARATTSATGGSVLIMRCSNTQVSSGGGGGATLVSAEDCDATQASELHITSVAGVHYISTSAVCSINDTIIIPDLSTFTEDEAIIMSIVNDSGVDLLVDATANTTVTTESGSSLVPDGSTFSVVQVASSSVHIIGTGGTGIDIDGNGLFESTPIFDADEDGSGWITCTAQNSPITTCKHNGERIYMDFADDLNCMIRGCGSIAASVEWGATIVLEKGVYVNFPCWSPSGANDPRVSTTHDSSGDTAYGDCPVGPDGFSQTVLTLAGWGGTVLGAGRSPGRTDQTRLTARGYGRTDATYIVNEMGNAEDAWFDKAAGGFRRGLQFGYGVQESNVLLAGTAAWIGTGGGGWGIVNALGASDAIEERTNASICVCDPALTCTDSSDLTTFGGKSWDIQTITTQSLLLFKGDLNSTSTKAHHSLITARVDANPDFVQSSNCDTNYVEVPLGLDVAWLVGEGALPGGIQELVDASGGAIYILRDDYLDSAAQFKNLTMEPQDWWNEEGGDCTDTGTFAVNDTSTDVDCDTDPMITIQGPNARPALLDVDIRYFHNFSIDGEGITTSINPILKRVAWLYGNGAPMMDPGHGWTMDELLVRDTYFSGNLIGNAGSGKTVSSLLIKNSSFNQIQHFAGQSSESWSHVRIENSSFSSAFSIGCGNQNIRIDDVYATGRWGGDIGHSAMLGLISFGCDDENDKTDFTFLSRLREDPPGSAVQTSGDYDEGAGQVLVRIRISLIAEFDNMGHVFLTDSSMYNDIVPTIGTPSVSAKEGCLVGIEDREGAGLHGSDGTNTGELDTLRLFKLSGNMVKGDLFCQFGGNGFWAEIASPSDSPLFDAHRSLMRGMNIEDETDSGFTESIYWPASDISASTGCTTAAESAIVSSGPLTFTIPCDPAVDTDGLMYFHTVLPDGFDKTVDVTFEISLQMTADSGAGTAYMSAAIQCTEQDTIFDTTFGTAIAASHLFVADDLVDELTQMTTEAVDTDTTGENCDGGDFMFVKLSMCGDDATPTTGCTDNNTFENDFSILGVKMEYTRALGD